MATIYKLSDRLKFKLHDTEVTISPMTLAIKSEMQKLIVQCQDTGDVSLLNEAMLLGIKNCVKGLTGLTNMDGSKYELSFDDDGLLSDESVEDLTNMEHSGDLGVICASMVRGTPTKLVDAKGKELSGVKLITKPAKKKAGKNTKK